MPEDHSRVAHLLAECRQSLDPTSPDRLPVADDPGRRVILVCHEGYSSSLAAHTLQQLGLSRATDLVGGYQAWASVTSARGGAR